MRKRDRHARLPDDGNPFVEPMTRVRHYVIDVVRLHGLAFTAPEILTRMPAYSRPRDFVQPSLAEVRAAMVIAVEKGELKWFHPPDSGRGPLFPDEPRVMRP